jgi:hypothetical protein
MNFYHIAEVHHVRHGKSPRHPMQQPGAYPTESNYGSSEKSDLRASKAKKRHNLRFTPKFVGFFPRNNAKKRLC